MVAFCYRQCVTSCYILVDIIELLEKLNSAISMCSVFRFPSLTRKISADIRAFMMLLCYLSPSPSPQFAWRQLKCFIRLSSKWDKGFKSCERLAELVAMDTFTECLKRMLFLENISWEIVKEMSRLEKCQPRGCWSVLHRYDMSSLTEESSNRIPSLDFDLACFWYGE